MTPMAILALIGTLLQVLRSAGHILDMDTPIDLSMLGDAHRQALKDAVQALEE